VRRVDFPRYTLMAEIVRIGSLFREVAGLRKDARATLERFGEPAEPEDVDCLIETALAHHAWPAVLAIMRRRRARAARAARC